MAGMQEQIRQLEDVNEDMMEDAERYAIFDAFLVKRC